MAELERRYWYPICGRKLGWCGGEGACEQPGYQLWIDSSCYRFLEKHPITGRRPHTVTLMKFKARRK